LVRRLTDSGHEDSPILLPWTPIPPEIISYAVWVYHRFYMSFRDVEDLLAERGIIVSFEAIRQWCRKFGPGYAQRLKRKQGRLGDIWHLDELLPAAISLACG
jgi:transposase-like protein